MFSWSPPPGVECKTEEEVKAAVARISVCPRVFMVTNMAFQCPWREFDWKYFFLVYDIPNHELETQIETLVFNPEWVFVSR